MRFIVGVLVMALAGWMPAQGIVTVLALDTTGAPVSGAGVVLDKSLVFMPTGSGAAWRHEGGFRLRELGEVHRTNVDGRVSIEGVSLSEHEVRCLTEQGAAARQMVTLSTQSPSAELRLNLDPYPFKGRVVEEAGWTMEDVEIHHVVYWRLLTGSMSYTDEQFFTDRDGNFALPALGRQIMVKGEGYPEMVWDVNPFEPIEAVLYRTVTLHGQVLMADGTPVRDEGVHLRRSSLPQDIRGRFNHGGWSGKTDSDGRFTARGLHRGVWELQVLGGLSRQEFSVDLTETTHEVFRAQE